LGVIVLLHPLPKRRPLSCSVPPPDSVEPPIEETRTMSVCRSLPQRLLAARRAPFLAKHLSTSFVFSSDNFVDPKLPTGLNVLEVPLEEATNESLKGLGWLVNSADEFTVEKKNFEITKWPVSGWRQLDPQTGDEAGTTEGFFNVRWHGDFFYGENLAIATENNHYLDGIGAIPEHASHESPTGNGSCIYLWMSDYHPDGGQLFFPVKPVPFTVCLGPAAKGDDIRPEDMRAFAIPKGKGVYIHPSTWHNGIYVAPQYTPAQFLTRQGRVHARVSVSWASEFSSLLRVPLNQ